MTVSRPAGDARLLIVGDFDRLGPLIHRHFAPQAMAGVRSYLAGIAEIARSPTRAVLVGHDPKCRNPESALAAMKKAAGPDVPVVFCCEPAYEDLGRRLLQHGADDYVIFPPEALDLERALRIPARATRDAWVAQPTATPVASAEELSRLAALLSRLTHIDAATLDDMAQLVCSALGAESAMVVVDGRVGRAGSVNLENLDAVLVEPITIDEQRTGQIRVGRRREAGFTQTDMDKLRHYGTLLGRLLESAQRGERWRELALTDDLTGLPNRRRLLSFLEEKIEWARRERATVTALVFDIDDFKLYNDRYGHDAGDEILTEVGRLFVQCCRKTDLVSRYGGDEFVVVFWDPQGPRELGSRPPQHVIDVLQRFRAALSRHAFARLGAEAVGSLTISGGLAHYPWQAADASGLLEAADRALLQAKEAGKNRFWLVGGGDVVENSGSAA